MFSWSPLKYKYIIWATDLHVTRQKAIKDIVCYVHTPCCYGNQLGNQADQRLILNYPRQYLLPDLNNLQHILCNITETANVNLISATFT